MQLYLWGPKRFRITEPEDVAKYGGDWWVWDEVALMRLPGRDMIALEEAVNMRLVAVIQGLRDDGTAAKLAAMWIAMHRGGHKAAWLEFNPMVHLAEWEDVPSEPDPLDSGEAPTPGESSSPEPSTESATS